MFFNPLAVAREVLRETDLDDPVEIAAEVFARTPDDAVADAYRSLLLRTAQDAIRFERMTFDFPRDHCVVDTHPRDVSGGTTSPTSHRVCDTHTAAAGGGTKPRKPNRSAKVTAIRNHHAAWKRARYVINGEWKMLADCTVDDVLALAEQRRAVAARNESEATRFDQLARAMKDAGVSTVADLDDDVAVAA